MPKLLIGIGVAFILMGTLIYATQRWKIAKLPGDIVIERPGVTIYFPIVTMLVASALMSAALFFVSRLWK